MAVYPTGLHNIEPDELETVLSHLPHSLVKALTDPFDYVLCLKNGTQFFFGEADYHLTDNPDWVHLRGIDPDRTGACKVPGVDVRMNFDRGVDVRLSEIAWCADAPFGS